MKAITPRLAFLFCLFTLPLALLAAKEQTYHVDSLAVDGGADSKGGRIVISATLGDPVDAEAEAKLIYAVDTQSTVNVYASLVIQETRLNVALKHGSWKSSS